MRRIVIASFFLLAIGVTGCGGSSSKVAKASSDTTTSTGGGTSGLGSTTDPMAGLFGGANGSGGTTPPTADSKTTAATTSSATSLTEAAEALGSLTVGNSSQQQLLDNAVSTLKSQAKHYDILDPGLSFPDLDQWLREQEAERQRLEQLAAQARQQQLDYLAELLEDLANRREVFVAAKPLRNGGWRHAFFRDPNLVAPHLQGYTFFGVMFQVYDHPQRIGQDVADLKLNGCAAQVTEDGRPAFLFFAALGCNGTITLPDLGFVSSKVTSRTQSPLFMNIRSVDNAGRPSLDFLNALILKGQEMLQYFAPFMAAQRYSIATAPFAYVP